ncbi:HAMP domain-containing sensor histidine kinase [Streptomyces sp. HUAS MG91]|uniref:histidine kinase n=1 Tax=Streptomyces tabacisoli TaxID=3156398 RepID=A0AAU8IKM6_9ACTN
MTRPPRFLVPPTLRGRLALVAVTTATLLTVVLLLVFHVAVFRQLQAQADDRLRGTVAAVSATVDTSGGRVRVRESANDEILDSNVWVYDGSRTVEQPSGVGRGPELARAAERLSLLHHPACATVRPSGNSAGWRLCADAVSSHLPSVRAVAALSLAPYADSADTLLAWTAGFGAVMLACTYVLTRMSVGRALRPVATMTDQAARWSAVSSPIRFASDTAPRELFGLGASLDALLDRIRTMLRHERQLTAELSHELRTPLARIVGELELLRARPRSAAETRSAQAAIADAAASMQAICDTLLADSRAGATGPSTVPGTSQVGTVLDRLAEAGARPGVRTTVRADPELRADVPEALLERLLSPLHANAVRYARANVTLSARPARPGVRIEVTDDGPGVPEAFVPYLFLPGRRACPDDGHDGAGLGLSLVLRLARSAGGTVRHDATCREGACFVVEVPG